MKYFTALVVIFSSMNAISQDKVHFGVNTGITYSGIRGLESDNQKNKYDFDFLIGASVEIPLSKKFSFLTGLNYERKSIIEEIKFSKLKVFGTEDPLLLNRPSSFTNKYTFNYLTLPADIKFHFGKNNLFFVNGGVQANLLLDKSAFYHTFDFGVNLGVGTKVKLSDLINLNIEIRDNLGLIKINDDSVYTKGNIKTNAINLVLNWEFNI